MGSNVLITRDSCFLSILADCVGLLVILILFDSNGGPAHWNHYSFSPEVSHFHNKRLAICTLAFHILPLRIPYNPPSVIQLKTPRGIGFLKSDATAISSILVLNGLNYIR